MRVLILGGDGMLGRKLRRVLAGRHDVQATVRRRTSDEPGLIAGPDVRDFARLRDLVAELRPEVVVNAVGVVKQRREAADAEIAIEVNALFPQRLARLCSSVGARLLHFSTDCVFSGRKGRYRESDLPDPPDLYGRSKLLGELGAPHLTLRSSIIGLEHGRQQGLVEWFLASRGVVSGYRGAIYSGLTTAEMARLVDRLLVAHRDLAGLFHVASEPIDKCSLLSRLACELGREDVRIEPADEPRCDRSLDGRTFAEATGYVAPSWEAMLRELAQEIKGRRSE
jgi:dTDP-4-dehydrorhamnose reductase